jgi:N-acetyl-anhydromuramyl-L-alanine amidase AmpD
MNKPKYILVHHTAGTAKDKMADTSDHTFEIVDNWHKELWNATTKSNLGHYIGYHYFIEKDGKLTQGRSKDEIGAHCIGYNDKSIGICLAGNFDLTLPTEKQENTLKELLTNLVNQYNIKLYNIVPHRKFSGGGKTCYGKNLSDNWAKNLVIKDNLEKQISIYQKILNILLNIFKGR